MRPAAADPDGRPRLFQSVERPCRIPRVVGADEVATFVQEGVLHRIAALRAISGHSGPEAPGLNTVVRSAPAPIGQARKRGFGYRSVSALPAAWRMQPAGRRPRTHRQTIALKCKISLALTGEEL